MSGRQRFVSWLAPAFALFLVAVQVPGVLRTAADPDQSDFANYFVPAFALANGHDVGGLYDARTFEKELTSAGLSGMGSFVPHPPANAMWLALLAHVSPAHAKLIWTGMLLLVLGLTVVGVKSLSADFSWSVATCIVFLPTLAIRNGLAFGQPYIILSALLVFGALAIQRQHLLLGGVLLGLGVPFKLYALAVGLLFLTRERKRALIGFLSGALAPCLLLLALTGPSPFTEFGSKVAPWMMRGAIQDPFSSGWGSVGSLAHRLFRFEIDLNPTPWLNAPLLARFLAASMACALIALGIVSARRAAQQGQSLDAIGAMVAFALAASPFVASYQLVLLTVSVAAVAARVQGSRRIAWLGVFLLVGSPLMAFARGADPFFPPAAFVRFFMIAAIAAVAAWPWIDRRTLGMAGLAGFLAGLGALPWSEHREEWPRVMEARGYSMMRPFFCGNDLRWLTPARDGRSLEKRGRGTACFSLEANNEVTTGSRPGGSVTSQFTDGSFNLFLQGDDRTSAPVRITFSDANEVDPVSTPDGCEVVFASDQDRGLGSTALYRIDISDLVNGCGTGSPVSIPR